MRKLLILLCTLAALTVALVAAATCPTPISGSSGSSGWTNGHAQTYITKVSIHPLNPAILIVNACDVGGTFCAPSNIDFGHAVLYYDDNPGAPDAHAFTGSLALPLRKFEVSDSGIGICHMTNGFVHCLKLAGDVTPGDLANRARIMISPVYTSPTAFGAVEAPIGYGVVKFSGVSVQSLRINYVNATHTGIATQNFPFSCSPG